MANKITYVGVNGVARKARAIYVGVNGVARKVTNAYAGVNGVAKKVYNSYVPVYAYTTETFSVSGYEHEVSNQWKDFWHTFNLSHAIVDNDWSVYSYNVSYYDKCKEYFIDPKVYTKLSNTSIQLRLRLNGGASSWMSHYNYNYSGTVTIRYKYQVS